MSNKSAALYIAMDAKLFHENPPFEMEYLSNRKTTYTNVAKAKVLTAVLHKEDDMYVAECPEVGTFSQGTTIEEAVDNLKEATKLYLEEFPQETKEKSVLSYPCTEN